MKPVTFSFNRSEHPWWTYVSSACDTANYAKDAKN
jgi:hypothetical protein